MRHVEKQPQRHLAKSRGDPPVAANRTRRRAFAFVTLIFVSTFLVYLPALKGGFVWDDGAHVTKPELRGVEGLARIWTELGATQQYYPLLHSVFWIEHRWWGDSPFGYHFINILLHAAAACLLSALLRRLAVPGAGLAGFLFALHPVCVESVAWISEQKNTLSTVLYFCAALAYLRFDANRRGRAYALASALFVLALLTKTVTATLPAALLVIFWWKRGRLDVSRDVLPLVPWLAAGTAMGWVTATVEQTLIGAQGVDFAFTALQRCLIAGRAICFYVGKLIWPTDLVFIYPRWAPDASAGWQYLFPLGVLGGAGFLWWRKQRGMLAGLLVFVGTLSPALGFVNVYPFIFSFVADHFQYPACAAVLVLAAAGTMHATARLPGWSVRMATAFALTALGVLTWRQSAMYRDEFTLYETTLARNSACWMAHNNLAEALAKANRVAEAIPHLERVLEMRP
ncbi:MAG: tetratricopeptide repeat protein, partial [Opitutaceae bacterium]